MSTIQEPEPQDELQSPLLDDGPDDRDSEGVTGGDETSIEGGAILHGEPVDLRHLFGTMASATGAATTNGSLPANRAINNADEKIEIGNGNNNASGLSSSTFSLGEQSRNANVDSNTHNGNFLVNGFMMIPRKGRLYYTLFKGKMIQMTHFLLESGKREQAPARNSSTHPKRHGNDLSNSSGRRKSSYSKHQKYLTKKSSLITSPSTPLLLKIILPFLLVANHVLFYHAQTKPMWNLTYHTDIAISATASTIKSKATFDALNIPHHYEFTNKETKVVETFTYMDAIRKLWKAEGLGGGRVELLSKISAALLVAFSGIWPHLKLVLVQFCWFWPFGRGVWLDDDGDDDYDEEDDEVEEEHDQGDANPTRNQTIRKRCNIKTTLCGCNNSEISVTRKRRSICFPSCSPTSSCSCCSDGHPHQSHAIRTPFLRTLSTLGKWSLADVFVVCILIAVLHLDWNVHPDDIRSGIEKELPTLLSYVQGKYPDAVKNCTDLLGYTCGKHALVIHYPACLACQAAINAAYSHPGWATSEGKDIVEGVTLEGGGYARLRVVGMIGTYYFCGAVVMSIVIGLVVEWIDGRDGERVEEKLLEKKREVEFCHGGGGSFASNRQNGDGGLVSNELELREEGRSSSLYFPSQSPLALNEALLFDNPASANNGFHHRSATGNLRTHYPCGFHDPNTYTSFAPPSLTRPPLPTPTTNLNLLKRVVRIILSIASLPLVYYAITLPTMRRLVYGGGPTLLHEVLGMVWTKEYNLVALVKTTGDAGGWDTFLMATFGMFVVISPILRSICLIMHILLGVPLAFFGDCIEQPRRRTTVRVALYRVTQGLKSILLSLIDALGSFCAWEVLIVALIMIQLEMPSITDTIYRDDRCLEADPDHGRTCIEVQFNALDNFLVVCIAWFVLIVASCLTMDLAARSAAEERDLTKEERKYEYGMPIPQRRFRNAQNGVEASITGSKRRKEQKYSAVQQDDEQDVEESTGREELEEIVFL